MTQLAAGIIVAACGLALAVFRQRLAHLAVGLRRGDHTHAGQHALEVVYLVVGVALSMIGVLTIAIALLPVR